MEWERVQSELDQLYPAGDWIEEDHGREIHCPYFLLKTWFLEFLISPRNQDSGHLRALVNFHFNFTEKERENFQKAEAMGLLPFHFYSRLESRIRGLGIDLIYYQDTDFSTMFSLEAETPAALKVKIQNMESCHLEITQTALECLETITKKYSLD